MSKIKQLSKITTRYTNKESIAHPTNQTEVENNSSVGLTTEY